MPIFDLTYPEGALSTETRDELMDGLTTAILRAERAPETDFFRDVTWGFAHELAGVYAGGRPAEKPHFKVEFTTPEGALSDRRRAELVEEATKLIREAAGIPDEEGLRVFVLCREIDEGSWGAAGQVIRFQQLRELAKAEREKAEETVGA